VRVGPQGTYRRQRNSPRVPGSDDEVGVMRGTINPTAWWARALIVFGLLVSLCAVPVDVGGASQAEISWASLGTLIPSAEQSSQYGSPVDASTTTSAYAWCGSDGIDVARTGGSVTPVSDARVEAMLAARELNINDTSKVACGVVLTDPLDPDKVYAGFEVGQNHSIPPIATVAMYTSDGGATWHFIPPPAKMTYLDFGGFTLRGNVVQAIFTDEVTLARRSSRWSIGAEAAGGGETWDAVSLACPTVGPCVSFGPELPQGACGMSSWQQALLVAVPGSLPGDPLWEGTSWAAGIPECDPALLFTDQHGDEYLLDFAMQNPLARSVDGGYDWQPVQLPKRDGHKVGGSPIAGDDVTAVTPSGDLLVVIGPAYSTTERLLLLAPGASQWCSVPGVLPLGTRTDPIRAIGATASRLVMLQESTKGTLGQGGAELSVPLTALHCSN
jgi:hypothetical protein